MKAENRPAQLDSPIVAKAIKLSSRVNPHCTNAAAVGSAAPGGSARRCATPSTYVC